VSKRIRLDSLPVGLLNRSRKASSRASRFKPASGRHIRPIDALSSITRCRRLTWFWHRHTAGLVWRHCNAPMKYVGFRIAERNGVVGYSILSAGVEFFHGLSIRGSPPGVLSPRHQSSSYHTKSQNYDQAIHDWFPCALCVSRSDLRPELIAGVSPFSFEIRLFRHLATSVDHESCGRSRIGTISSGVP
jgi:hypothetical protein